MIIYSFLIYAVPISLIIATLWTGVDCAKFYKEDIIEKD